MSKTPREESSSSSSALKCRFCPSHALVDSHPNTAASIGTSLMCSNCRSLFYKCAGCVPGVDAIDEDEGRSCRSCDRRFCAECCRTNGSLRVSNNMRRFTCDGCISLKSSNSSTSSKSSITFHDEWRE